MATDAYRRWAAAGRPFRRPPWLVEIKAQARAAGVEFLGDLGNDDHLQDENPQDHAPFSFTAWPIPLPDYVICAIDLGRGTWAYTLLAWARAGLVPWLKYMNIDGKNYSRRRGGFMIPAASSDTHGHLSGMSDHTYAPLPAGQNPFTGTQGGTMADPVEEIDASYVALTWRTHTMIHNLPAVPDNEATRKVGGLAGERNALHDALAAVAVAPSPVNVVLTDVQFAALLERIGGAS